MKRPVLGPAVGVLFLYRNAFVLFLNPLAWWLALLAVPIIVFYILKVRLRQEPVSTTIFWQQVFEERRSRSFWRHLRHLFSLLVNLAFLALLVAALLDPMFRTQERKSRAVVVFDNSASMNAGDDHHGKSRFDEAKSQLGDLLSATAARRQTAILTAGGEPHVVAAFTNHLGTLRDAVASIPTTDAPTSLTRAVALARHLTAGEKDAAIYVFTDGCSPEIEPLLDAPDVRVVPIGNRTLNVAITRFQPRRSLVDPVGYELLVEVLASARNAGDTEGAPAEPVECRLEIDLDGDPLDVLPLTLEPGVPQTRIVRGTIRRGGLLRGTLDQGGALAADDTAVALLPDKSVQKLLLLGEEDFFLRHVLESQPNTEMEILSEPPPVVPPDAVLVLHRTVPPVLPHGNVLVIDPRGGCDLFTVGDPLESPLVGEIDKDSPLMRFVHLENVLVPGARKIELKSTGGTEPEPAQPEQSELPEQSEQPEGGATDSAAHTLAATPEGLPVYLDWNRTAEQSKVVLLTAELARGDLALRTAFPIMIAQSLAWFRGDGGELERAHSTAEAITVPLEIEAETVVLRAPDGTERVLPVKSGEVALGTLPRCGVWEIFEASPKDTSPKEALSAGTSEEPEPIKRLACNLVNAPESDLSSNPDRFFEARSIESMRGFGSRPLWFWIALAAIALTTTEWYLYQRRWID